MDLEMISHCHTTSKPSPGDQKEEFRFHPTQSPESDSSLHDKRSPSASRANNNEHQLKNREKNPTSSSKYVLPVLGLLDTPMLNKFTTSRNVTLRHYELIQRITSRRFSPSYAHMLVCSYEPKNLQRNSKTPPQTGVHASLNFANDITENYAMRRLLLQQQLPLHNRTKAASNQSAQIAENIQQIATQREERTTNGNRSRPLHSIHTNPTTGDARPTRKYVSQRTETRNPATSNPATRILLVP